MRNVCVHSQIEISTAVCTVFLFMGNAMLPQMLPQENSEQQFYL